MTRIDVVYKNKYASVNTLSAASETAIEQAISGDPPPYTTL